MRNIRNTLLDGINPVTIRACEPKDVNYIINKHRELYDTEYGFGSEFSDYVEKYVLKFDEHHDESKANNAWSDSLTEERWDLSL